MTDWQGPFASWVRRYGARRLAARLGVTPPAVYGWVAGRYRPRPAHLEAILETARGELGFRDIYRREGPGTG